MKKLLFLLLFLGTSLLASIATVTAVKGEVEIVRNEKSINAVVGFSLNIKDRVLTIGKSVAQLSFKDDTVITLGKNSDFKISDYAFEPKVKKTRFSIAKGVFKSITGKIGKVAPKKFKIKTKTATMGIRGTTVIGRVSDTESTFACTVGAIAVTSNATGEVVRVNAGQITKVGIDAAPTVARAFTSSELSGFEEDLSAPTATEEQEDNQNGVSAEDKKENTTEQETETQENVETEEEETIQTKISTEEEVEQIGETQKEQDTQANVKKDSQAEAKRKELEGLPDVKSSAFNSEDGLIKWGYWLKGSSNAAQFSANEVKTVWLEGIEATASRIEQLQLANVKKSYSGDVRGIVAQEGSNDFIDSGDFSMTFDFGAVQPLQDSSFVRFTQAGQRWQVNNLTGKIEGNTFTIDGFSTSQQSDAFIQNGDFSGKFFGSNAQSLGAVFTLQGTVGGVQKIATGTLLSK